MPTFLNTERDTQQREQMDHVTAERKTTHCVCVSLAQSEIRSVCISFLFRKEDVEICVHLHLHMYMYTHMFLYACVYIHLHVYTCKCISLAVRQWQDNFLK